MTRTIFTGCSYTEGIGLPETSNDENLWVNIVHASVLSRTELLNLGKSGASNADIFKNTIDAISLYNCKYLFVQWTELQRYWINPSVEKYTTSIFFSNGASCKSTEININPGITYKKNYIENIKNRFIDLHHDHYDIIKVLEYSKIIKQMCDRLGIMVFFINGILPWDADYFTQIHKTSRVPSDTTEYTQHQLNAATRNDDEYFVLYDKIHSEYLHLTVAYPQWLNLYSGFRKCFYLDQGNDALHPGFLSNEMFANHLIEKLSVIDIR